MNDPQTTVSQLKNKLSKFVKDRDWEQYHSPKSLSISIAIEAAELMEHFQWLDNRESIDILKDTEKLSEIKRELADISIYILDFCNVTNVDLSTIIVNKLEENAKKYPAEKVKGKAHKYTYYESKER
jgi:dCTP diphosphatase